MAGSHSGLVRRTDNPKNGVPHRRILPVPWVRIPHPPPKQDNTLPFLFLSGLVPVRAFALWTHARLVVRVARYPFVLASLARVLIDADFLFHGSALYT